jgi:Cu(I)/Ag(I) efflux system membrane fusion protein
LKDQFRTGTKKVAEQMSRLQQKLGGQFAHLRENLAALYWNRTPEHRQRIRQAAVAFAILSLGIVLGRLTDINRAVQIDKSDKTLKVEKNGTLELKLPGVTLNPAIYVFQEAKTTEVPIEIKVPGRLAFNAEKSKVISARVAGRVERIFAFDGAAVNLGSPILEMYSPDFNSAQQEYLLASRTVGILGKNQAMGDLMQDAKMTQDAASNRLRTIGVSDQEIAQLGASQKVQANLLLRSPIQGVVTKRNIEPGAIVSSGDVLASLADPKA